MGKEGDVVRECFFTWVDILKMAEEKKERKKERNAVEESKDAGDGGASLHG
ncbi:hypothetical protein GCM10007981_09880 [Thermocladium modestius]|uniref:Uncharacterized protein n=1 Tax=Thermocladium modestius TaxID=62609 RepID=A0A830GVP5_9CREN|nr:hypothetical protein [Thermocladium modestius]GGP20708.1 hypothetical protein GCM10007981_09880 [Thermocladium modestius]